MADFQDLQDFSPILQHIYLPTRKKAFPKMTVGLAAARKGGPDRVTFAGGGLLFDVKLGKRGGFISSAAGFFPEATLARERQGRLGIARTYAISQVDGLASKATQNRGSYISAAKKMTEDVMEQWQIEQERILHSDHLGIRALVVAKTSDTVFTCASPYGISGAGPGGLHLEVGDNIASLDVTAGNALMAKSKIVSITHSGDTATVTTASDWDGAATGAAGDLIVTAVPAAIDATDTSFGAEPHGWKSIMDVEGAFATFQGIKDDRWVAQKLTSTTVDETVVMKLLNIIRGRAGVDWRANPRAMLLLTTTGIWTQYGDSLLGLRRFSAPKMELNGGFRGVQVAGATLVDDPWAPRGRLYAIHAPDTIFVDLMDFGTLSFNDSPRWRLAQTRDAGEAVFGTYWNYGVTIRSSHGVISGITDTDNFSPVF